MCTKEFCNAYTELNDPFDQRERFAEQVSLESVTLLPPASKHMALFTTDKAEGARRR